MPSNPNPPLDEGSLLAAVDLGSNSFHLIVARLEHGEIRPVHTLAEKVQLGAGLIDSKLTDEAIERGLACLARFGQLLASVEPLRVRVVGTNALRQAKNRRAFTEPAEKLLGVPIDVVYGREEARLVYVGVAHTLSDDEQSRLVVDIGGGSTEFIIGERFEPRRLESLQLGCVSYAKRYFPDGVISKNHFKAAYDAAAIEVSHIRRNFRSKQWSEAVGSSGTLKAVELLIAAEGWRDDGIDRDALDKLRKRLLKFNNSADIDIEGLSEKRRHVITAGVAIISAIFDVLDITQMRTSKGALREGVIYDLMGRLSHEDVRERSITAMIARYSADESTGKLVSDCVGWLAEAVADEWQFSARDIELLKWAGYCHEIGGAISQKHLNRHSAYLLRNSDLPGFSQGEQEVIATLVLSHRGKLKPEMLSEYSETQRPLVAKMVALLRLAVIFKYVDDPERLKEFGVAADGDDLRLTLPDDWQVSHPLTTWELEQARSVISKFDIRVLID